MNKLLFWAFICCASPSLGQTFLMNGTPVNSCSGVFYDGGGPAGPYSNNQNLSAAICPDGTGNTHVALTFSSLALQTGDQLCIYDGPNVLAPLLTCFTSTPVNLPQTLQASASNASGCLAVSFLSNTSGTADGWAASLSCVNPCPLPAPINLQVVYMNNGNMIWTWSAVPGSLGYEVNINGIGWQPANGNLSHTVSGLVPGNLVVLEVRGVSGSAACPAISITANQTYVECMLQGGIDALFPALCFGTATGSSYIISSGAAGILQYFADGSTTPSLTGDFVQVFAAGQHEVVIRDAAGCLDTVLFTIDEPPPVSVTDTVTDVKCHGTNSGALYAAANGGTPPYSYTWQGCQGGAVTPDSIVGGLFAGCYAVTATDANGCTAVTQDSIQEPPAFDFDTSQDSVSCFGGMNGSASVQVTGATPPFSFKWANSDTTATADSLKAGFHSVTVTDSKGCEAVTLVQVLEPKKLIIDSISVSHPLCFGGATGSATVSVQGGVPAYQFQWSNAQFTQTIVNLTAGPYTVTVSDKNGCTASFGAAVNAPPDLQIQLVSVQNQTCAGICNGQMTLVGNGGTGAYTISWSDPSIPAGTLVPQNLCPGPYGVTVTDANGCTRTTMATIQAATAIALSLGSTPPVCAGDQNGSITAVATGGASSFQFTWSNGVNGASIQNLPCGIYTVTATDALGCTQVQADTLPCSPALVLDSILVNPVRCFGEANGNITVYVQGGTGTLQYDWSDPNQQTGVTAQFLLPGNYTVTVTDANGCSLTASAAVNEPQALNATVTASPVTCFGGNDGTAQAQVAGGVVPFDFLWNVPQPTATITGLTAGLYSVTVTDSRGCTFVGPTVQVTQPASPVTVAVNQTRLACFGQNDGQALASASGSNGPPFDFSWSHSFNGPAPANLGLGAYAVTATDPKGCTGTQSITIQQWSEIQVGVNQVPPTCQGGFNGQAFVNFVSGGAGNSIIDNYQYFWSQAPTVDTIYVNNLTGGQTYFLTVSDMQGCSLVYELKLTDQQPIIPQIRVDSVSCFGLSDGSVHITSVQSAFPIAGYQWSSGDSTKDLNNRMAGIYTVTLTDTQGCTSSTAVQVYEPDLLQVQLEVTGLICNIDSNAVIKTRVEGGKPPYSYTWNTGDNAAQLEQLGPGIYALTVTDQNGCTATAETAISQPSPPTIQVEMVEPACFGGKDGYFRLLVSNGAAPYRYSLDGQNFNGSSVFLGLGAGQYTAYVLDAKGCVTAAFATITQPPPVQVSLPPDTTLTLGDSVLIAASLAQAVEPVSYFWDGALVDSFRCADLPDCSSIWIFPVYTNTFSVTVFDANGCSGKASMRIELEKPRGAFVPTGFSPNGDFNNDLLVVHGKSRQIRQVKLFRVYDRWGELLYEDQVFQVNDEQRGWDGRFRGQECRPGVYVWHLVVEYLDGYEQALQGNTTLVR